MTREELLREREATAKYVRQIENMLSNVQAELQEIDKEIAGMEKKNCRVIKGAVMTDQYKAYGEVIHGISYKNPIDYETFCRTLASCSGEPMNYFAMDEDFELYWYSEKPTKRLKLFWDYADDGKYGKVMYLRDFPALLPPDGWENSLVETTEVE
jgi:hypothetical protein